MLCYGLPQIFSWQGRDNLIDALIAHRERQEASGALTFVTFLKLQAGPADTLVARALARDPIGYALHRAMREIARLLAAKLGFEQLRVAHERYGEEDYRRLGPLDWAFDGAVTRDGAVWLK
jgi:hypothetical protein